MDENYTPLSKARNGRQLYQLDPAEQFAYEQASLLGFDAGFLPVSWTRKPQQQFIADLKAVQSQVERRLVAQSCRDEEAWGQCEASPSLVRTYASLLEKLFRLRHTDYLQSDSFAAALESERERQHRLTTQISTGAKTWNALKTHRKFALVLLNPECATFVTRAPIVLHGLSQANIGHWAMDFRFDRQYNHLYFLQLPGDEEFGHPHIFQCLMCFGGSTLRAEQMCCDAYNSTAKMKALLSFVYSRLQMHTDGEYSADQRMVSTRRARMRDNIQQHVTRYRTTLQNVLEQYEPNRAPAPKKGRHRAK